MECQMLNAKQFLYGMLLLVIVAISVCSGETKGPETCQGPDGKTYNLHEKFIFGEFWYECISNGSCPYCKVSGCVSPDGKYLNNNDQYTNASYVYTCEVLAGGTDTPRHVVSGCLSPDGKKLVDGESYVRDKFVYQCESSKTTHEVRHKLIGCSSPDGKAMKSGDQYEKDGGVYECQAPADGQVKLVVVGCMDNKGGKVKIGESWLHPASSEFQYRNLCQIDKETVSVKVVSCKYSGSGFNLELKPGCYHAVDQGESFTCSEKFGDGGIYIDFTSKKEDLAKLKQCESTPQ